MDELDKKLEEIVFGSMPKHCMSDDMLAKPEQIKQAFLDAGWTQEPRQYDAHGNLKINGQEWYDRFIESLDVKFSWMHKSEYERYMSVIEQCKEAAKKASGIQQ